jgi:prephenate dehydrogenase
MNTQLTIIGLNQLGLSFAMALASQGDTLTRIGIDRHPEIAIQAEKKGQINKAVFNLEKSVEQSSVVLLCLPSSEVRETLEVISRSLPENAVVLDTSPIAVSAQQWAADLLPQKSHFLTFFPTLNPACILENVDSEPQADLFKNGQVVICSANDTPIEAVNLVSGLARVLEAVPFFCDSFEFQGWYAQTHNLPQLMSAALLRVAASQPAWRDAGRIAGSSFSTATHALKEADAAAWQLNRDNLTRVLDQYIAALQDCRHALVEGDTGQMETLLDDSLKISQAWEKQRCTPGDKTPAAQQLASSAETLGSIFGITQFTALFKPKK